jgi:hypothetical protein
MYLDIRCAWELASSKMLWFVFPCIPSADNIPEEFELEIVEDERWVSPVERTKKWLYTQTPKPIHRLPALKPMTEAMFTLRQRGERKIIPNVNATQTRLIATSERETVSPKYVGGEEVETDGG